jgi:sugar (pentulose or hexulose) kinase
MTLGEYLEWRWLGVRRVTPSNAAWTGLLNRTTLTWHTDWLAAVGMPIDALAPVVDVDVAHTGLLPVWNDAPAYPRPRPMVPCDR